MAEESGHQAPPPPGRYPSPQPYPSPQMRPTYAWPPSQGEQSNEPYRQSPGQINPSLPPMNLPPLRSIDGQPPAQSHPHHSPHQSGPPIPQQGQPMSAYYPPPPQSMSHHGLTSSPNMMRYAIPQSDAHLMSGSRHKKEIKRRTKTGCLTCRKRRIKCDELHPVCRNCQKSKRECLGYDPIFKQQSGPQQLQPAPSASPSSTSSTPAAASSAQSTYTPTQTSYTPPMNSAYGSAPNAPPHPPSSSHPPPQKHYHDHNLAIDPALAGAEAASAAPSTYNASHDRQPSVPGNNTHPAPVVKPERMERKSARLLRVDELFSINQYGPSEIPTNPGELPVEKMDEIKTVYVNDYAPGLDGILETSWFSAAGWERLRTDRGLCQLMAQLIEYFKQVTGSPGNYENEVRCRATETKVVWQLLSMVRPLSPAINGTNGSAPSMTLELNEANKRLDILEAILTNRVMESNRAAELVYPSDLPIEKVHEIEFWKSLGKFVSLNSEDPSVRHELDGALAQCRNMLFSRENRDVIYSVMVARHVGARVPEFPDHIHHLGPGGEENDFNKLWIAKTFISEQASHKGTNNPIMRVCDMVIRSWSMR